MTSVPPQPATEAPRFPVRHVAMVGVVAVLLVAAAGVAGYAEVGDVPRGTTVLGVVLGARSRADAERALHARFDAHADDPVAVRLDGTVISVAPRDIAMALDVGASVGRAAAGRTRLLGSRAVPPVVRLDADRLEALLRTHIAPGRVTLRQPAIGYRGVTPLPTYPKAGVDLDPAQAADAVRGAWLTGRTAQVPLAPRTPATTREQVDALVRGPATAAVAAPITVTVGARSFTLDRNAIAASLSFHPDATGRLVPAIDGGRLHAAAATEFGTVETAPERAGIVRAGRPVIVAGTAGELVDPVRLGADLLAVLPRPAPRRVTASLVRTDSEITDVGLAELGVRAKISTFTTYFTGGADSPRSRNIATVARAVDGATVRPGETFSLNGHTGDRNYAAGYHDAPVIVGGRLEPGVGGGASQFTTTLFNAAYYAGLQDVEHKPHSFYFSRYPAVIESTIFYPTLDLKFKNTTPYGILIDTTTTGTAVTVAIWSTRFYDSVRTVRSPRRNPTAPPTVYREPGPKCISSSGLPGFTQDAWRIIRKDGKEIKREKFTWRYDPEPRFVCGAKP